MKIYHYTTIENLALILKHKTIRFNRLDNMEDPCEKTFLMNQTDWSPYIYVSCWTENPEESIPLWHTYTDGGNGVRIGIDKDFIDWDKQSIALSVPSRHRHHKSLSKDSSGALSATFNPTRIYHPLSDEVCYHKIDYLSEKEYLDYEQRIGRVASFIEIDEELMRKYAGRIRKDKWAFQDESRFIIYAVPYTSTDPIITHNDFINLIRMGVHNQVSYIDVPIKAHKLRDIEITLGPNIDEGKGILAKAVINKYAPSAQLAFSSLTDSPVWYMV